MRDLAAKWLDPYFVREEELGAIIDRRSRIAPRQYRYVQGSTLNFTAKTRAITVIDEIDIYHYQSIGSVGGYYGYVQYDLWNNYTREFTIASNTYSAAGAVNIHWHFGRYNSSRDLDDTQCEFIPLPYTVLQEGESIRAISTALGAANTANTILLVFREFDLEP